MVFQLQDDQPRLEIASLAPLGDTSEAALAVLDMAVAALGVPQRLLTDNAMALTPVGGTANSSGT